jgi:hypothetical protein
MTRINRLAAQGCSRPILLRRRTEVPAGSKRKEMDPRKLTVGTMAARRGQAASSLEPSQAAANGEQIRGGGGFGW